MPQIIENTQLPVGNQQYNGAKLPSVVPHKLSYSFDYKRFLHSDLENKAKSTLGNFFGFMRATLDGLLEIGRMLRELYNECVASLPDGKKVFEQWISSEDFGASQYLAKSSMEIAGWFDGLKPIRQESMRSKVQRWSISALLQLSKVADKFLEEVMNGGKKTAAQVKRAAAVLSGSKVKSNSVATSKITALSEVNPVELMPGMRIVVKTNDAYKGSTGEIKEQDGNNFWVLLDYTVASGGVARMLLKPEQLVPEPKIVTKNSKSERLFTAEEVEKEVQKRLEAYKQEKEEEMIGKAVEAEEAGKKAVGTTIKSYQQRLQVLEQNKQELLKQLDATELELAALRSLEARNKQLEQRVSDLEKVIDSSNQVTKQKAPSPETKEVVNPDLVLLLPVLLAEVKELKGVVLMQEKELTQLRVMNVKQQEEINGRQYPEFNSEIEEIIKEFGSVGESLGWNGWNRYGYRAADGTLYRDIDAMKSFISDLKQEYQESREEVMFQN